MKVEVIVPRHIVEEFVETYTELTGSRPTTKQVESFFQQDIKRVYEETVAAEGFADAI